ncbi:MAG: ABC transporter ATP-binding protein [Chitinophagaceae bacterium]|nr:ABC transporter ATP-binding protein [Chitinophagaceae bacterium]
MKKLIFSTWQPKHLWRAAHLVWQADKTIAAINILLQLLQALLPVLTLYFIKLLVEQLVLGINFNHVVLLLAAFGGLQLLLAMAAQFANYIQTIHQQKLADYMLEKVLRKAIEVDYSYYENPAYHDTLHLAQQQSLYRLPQLLSSLSLLLQSGSSVFFMVIFFFTLQSSFALLFVFLCMPLATIKWYYGFALQKQERQFVPLEREANYLYQSLTATSYAKEVRIFGFGNSFIAKFKKIRLYIQDEKKKLHLKLALFSLLAEVFEILAMAFIFYFLAKQAWSKAITVGVFVIYVQGFQRLQGTTKNFLQSLVQVFQLKIFLQDLFAFFDIELIDKAIAQIPFPTVKDGLHLNNVSFNYPATNKRVLHQINIACKPGQIIAIVGENGSGKSTLVKLLAGLYHLEEGNIQFDGIELNTILPSSFRNNSIFVFQDFEKYFFTVEENIALSNTAKTLSSQNVQQAATLSGADKFIQKLAKGYQTRMGNLFDGSEQLSGGQWQKLTLSRMFYKDVQLIVLDEPTSSLDANAEMEIFKNVKEHLKNKMVIIISHRLYNLKMANTIYVMDDGQIAEQGSFDELVNKQGIFRKMYDAQKL